MQILVCLSLLSSILISISTAFLPLSRTFPRSIYTRFSQITPLPTSMSIEESQSYCCESPNAVIVTLWPSAGEVSVPIAETFFRENNAKVLAQHAVRIKKEAAVNVVRALYDGEDWLESNCWYHEQPLPEGPPSGPFAGAKWKAALCFKDDRVSSNGYYTLQVFVLNAEKASSLWSCKYAARSAMSRAANAAGNSCMHLTDSQKGVVQQARQASDGTSFACDDSYAFQCARCLLDERSVSFLNALGESFGTENDVWKRYTDWLQTGDESNFNFKV